MAKEYLDGFQRTLENGLVKICSGAGVISDRITRSDDEGALSVFISLDIEGRWEAFLKDYVADAVQNFNQWPDAALAWPAFLGMAVANGWDKDWKNHANDSYTSFYGSRGWDDMDEHILYEVLHLGQEYGAKLSDVLLSCSQAVTGLLRHDGIEAQTETGFYCLVRAYGVMFRIGAAIELERLGYGKGVIPSPASF